MHRQSSEWIDYLEKLQTSGVKHNTSPIILSYTNKLVGGCAEFEKLVFTNVYLHLFKVTERYKYKPAIEKFEIQGIVSENLREMQEKESHKQLVSVASQKEIEKSVHQQYQAILNHLPAEAAEARIKLKSLRKKVHQTELTVVHALKHASVLEFTI